MALFSLFEIDIFFYFKKLLFTSYLVEGNGYEGRQTSKGELFVKVFGMSRDFDGAHIDFKMAASM